MASTTQDRNERTAEKVPQAPNAFNNDEKENGVGETGNEQGSSEGKEDIRIRNAKDQEKKVLRFISHVVRRQYERAEENHVGLKSFNLIEALDSKLPLPLVADSAWTVWDDATSRATLDGNGIPVLYHFPKWITESFIDKLNTACIEAIGEEVALSLGDHNKDSYVFTDGEHSGQLDFATAVPHEDGRILISQSLCDGFSPLATFMDATKFLSHRVNDIVETIDPVFHDGLKRMRAVINQTASTQCFAGIDPVLMEARSLTFNQRTPLHANDEDLAMGWRVIVSLCTFTEGGYVRIPRLGLRVRFFPGDTLVLRGSVLEHEVEAWSGGT